MRKLLILGTIILLTSCSLTDNEGSQRTTNDTVIAQIDNTLSQADNGGNASYSDAYDSLARAPVDTSTLQGKRKWIMNQFLLENGLVSPDYDTLFDLTYDGFNDYVIGYYGKSGTGIKNRVNVYLFNPKRHSYTINELLSDLPNPTLYIKHKKITGFYIGNGGGGGQRLEWIKNKWTITKEFEVENDDDTTKWEITYHLKKKKQVIVRPFKMIPPEEILETDIKW